jgi:hypothetical protein
VYEKLMRDSKEHAARFSFLYEQLFVRSYVIKLLGSIPGDPRFDVISVIECLWERLPLRYEQAMQKAQQVRATDVKQWGGLIDDLRALRWTKDLLGATAQLHAVGHFQQAPDIARWFYIRETLP